MEATEDHTPDADWMIAHAAWADTLPYDPHPHDRIDITFNCWSEVHPLARFLWLALTAFDWTQHI